MKMGAGEEWQTATLHFGNLWGPIVLWDYTRNTDDWLLENYDTFYWNFERVSEGHDQ